MKFVNTPYCDFVDCYCINFVQDLCNLCKELLAIEDVSHQWTAFERFKRHFIRSHRFKIKAESFKMCSSLLDGIHKLKCDGRIPSTLFVDLMAVIYFYHCGKLENHLVECIQETHFLRDRETVRALGAFRTKSDFMKILLNFGYLSSLCEESPHLRAETYRILVHFIWSVSRPDDTYSVFKELVKLLQNSFFRTEGKANIYKRLYLVGCALHAVKDSLKKDHVQAEEIISSLKMYFSAAPDPYLTIFEVRCVLYALFTLLNKLDLFDEYSEEFGMLMPECPARTEPRTLSHLARCQVRQNLKASNLPLPAAVDKLGMPRILKSFILGDVMNFPRKSANVSSQDVVTITELGQFLSERPRL